MDIIYTHGHSASTSLIISVTWSTLKAITSINIQSLRLNSTVGMFEGFSDFGIRTAELWNNNTAILQQTRAKVDTYCKPNAEVFEAAIHSKKGM